MDAPGATMSDAGRDSLMLGVSTTLPVSRSKYEAMRSQATRENFAAHASLDEVISRLDAQLRDLWEQAIASQQTLKLYDESILPQARQTLEADLQSLANNSVTFDRVIRDYRTVLNLELGYHRALGQQAITLARIRQTVGTDLMVVPTELPPSPETSIRNTHASSASSIALRSDGGEFHASQTKPSEPVGAAARSHERPAR